MQRTPGETQGEGLPGSVLFQSAGAAAGFPDRSTRAIARVRSVGRILGKQNEWQKFERYSELEYFEKMSLELDHVFCFCDPVIPEVQILEEAGFILTNGRVHHGQGTANRSVVFHSSYLELIYLESESDALTNPLRLQKRANWKVTGSSPFGIALRGQIPTENQTDFWEYRPPYNPSRAIMMHKYNEKQPDFPLLFVMPSSPASAGTNIRMLDSFPHKTGSTHITRVTIQTPYANWPLSMAIKGLTLEAGTKHRMEVEVDGTGTNMLQLNELLSLTFRKT